ncbi:MAG: endonuclease III, partial [Microcystis sp.]
MAPRKKTQLQLHALEILSNLKRLYPEATCSLNYQTPVQLLVA